MPLLLLLQALAALNEYHAAVSEASVTIRNKPAYLMGILRKYKQGQRAPLGNGTSGGMATAPKAMGRMGVSEQQTPTRARVLLLYSQPFFSRVKYLAAMGASDVCCLVHIARPYIHIYIHARRKRLRKNPSWQEP